jgi:hypothetical protein
LKLSYIMSSATTGYSVWSHVLFKKGHRSLSTLKIAYVYCVPLKTNVISTSNEQVACINSSLISVIQNSVQEFVHYFVPEMLSYRNKAPWMTLILIRYVYMVLCNEMKSLHSACYFNTNTIRPCSKFGLDLHLTSSATC